MPLNEWMRLLVYLGVLAVIFGAVMYGVNRDEDGLGFRGAFMREDNPKQFDAMIRSRRRWFLGIILFGLALLAAGGLCWAVARMTPPS